MVLIGYKWFSTTFKIEKPGRKTTGKNTHVVFMSVLILWVCFYQYFHINWQKHIHFFNELIKEHPQMYPENISSLTGLFEFKSIIRNWRITNEFLRIILRPHHTHTLNRSLCWKILSYGLKVHRDINPLVILMTAKQQCEKIYHTLRNI